MVGIITLTSFSYQSSASPHPSIFLPPWSSSHPPSLPITLPPFSLRPGVFLDSASVRKLLRSKYHSLSEAALKSSKWLLTDVTSQDVGISVRLVISYK